MLWLVCCVFVGIDRYSLALPLLWLAAIALLFHAAGARWADRPRLRWPPGARWLSLAALLALPVAVRLASIWPDRLHGDEALTGFFSTQIDLLRTNFFGAVPLSKSDWICQYPPLFFFIQKAFFVVFGESWLSLKLSLALYLPAIALFLHLIARELFGERVARLSLVLYAFFPMSLYIETMALHVYSSTTFYLIFFWLLLRHLRQPTDITAVASGAMAGVCYLSYFSSWIAIPVAIVLQILVAFRQGRASLRHLAFQSGALLVVMGPFIAHVLAVNAYPFVRIRQVSPTDASPFLESALWSLKSLVIDGPGGHDGFNFGHRALFEPMALMLFALGLVDCLVRVVRGFRPGLVGLLLALGTSLGMLVATFPPGGYHRTSLSYPFIAMVMALPLERLLLVPIAPRRLAHAAVGLLLLAYACVEYHYFHSIAQGERNEETTEIARLVETGYRGRRVYISAFPSFALSRILHFALSDKTAVASSDFPHVLIGNLGVVERRQERYLYIIAFADDDVTRGFERADPAGRIVARTRTYALFAN